MVDLFSSYNCQVQIEIWLIDGDPTVLSLPSNYMNCSGFELNGHSRLEALEVVTCRPPVRCWMDIWRDLEEVQNWPLQPPRDISDSL